MKDRSNDLHLPNSQNLAIQKTSSAPIEKMKNRLGNRDKLSYSPKKTHLNQNHNGQIPHQSLHYGSYSPEKPKICSNTYSKEFYSQPNTQWQGVNPQIVNINSKKRF